MKGGRGTAGFAGKNIEYFKSLIKGSIDNIYLIKSEKIILSHVEGVYKKAD